MISRPIAPVTFLTPLTPLSKTPQSQPTEPAAASFEKILGQALGDVNNLQIQSENLDSKLAAGQVEYLHQATVTGEKATLALDLAIQVRNKVIDAYQEIMRTQM